MRLAALFPLCLAAPAAAMPPEVKAMLDGALSGGDAARSRRSPNMRASPARTMRRKSTP